MLPCAYELTSINNNNNNNLIATYDYFKGDSFTKCQEATS